MIRINKNKAIYLLWLIGLALYILIGCQTPSKCRLAADKRAIDIIKIKQKQALGQVQEFTIERPSDILRRRLLVTQKLPYAAEASLGADALKTIEHWPENDYHKIQPASGESISLKTDTPLCLSLFQALQIGARNSFDYQTRKEEIFQTALALDLEHDEFRNSFSGQIESLISTDTTGKETINGTKNSAKVDIGRKLKSGAKLAASLAVDLANLLTLGGASSMGIMADATVSIPLLRGSSKHIVTEALTRAERNVVYAIYEFERFKRTFAVDIAAGYFGVLRQLDRVENAEQNYRSLVSSARRTRSLADAGRLPEMQVDQAIQNELNARNTWISAIESYKRGLDSFKIRLGLPPDAEIELDSTEFEKITASTKILEQNTQIKKPRELKESPAAAHPEDLVAPGYEGAGPFEIDQAEAIKIALNNRLDLRVVLGKVYDSQRQVVLAADALGAELTLLGTSQFGQGRSISTARLEDSQLNKDKGRYSALLSLDLPFERAAEGSAYRNSFINLEQSVRNVQQLEDNIKLSIRNKLGDLLESRESLHIQTKALYIARKRVKSANLFLQAGRVEIRDLLEAQDALLSAQNSLTSAVINYRIAELELQRDMGVLDIDEKGLWREYLPENRSNIKNE